MNMRKNTGKCSEPLKLDQKFNGKGFTTLDN